MQLMQVTTMALLLAHFLGDFPFQLQWIADNKCKRLWPLICHGITHYILAWTCLFIFTQTPFFTFSSQIVVTVYVATHLLTDKLKQSVITRNPSLDNWKIFLSDQTIHAVVLTIAAAILTGTSITAFINGIQLSQSARIHLLETATTYVAVVFGGGYLIRYLTRAFAINNHSKASLELKNAGLYVGWLERFLIITAIAMQSPALVGLIMTGKSIARFPEFKEKHFAEYFLIGTLLSMSLSVVGGILLLQLWYGTISLR